MRTMAQLQTPPAQESGAGDPVLFLPDTEGVWVGLKEETYRQAPGVSQSMLRVFARSPAHLQAMLAAPPEPTHAMVLGRIFHTLVLEPQAAPYWRIAPPGMDLRTREGKQWKSSAGRSAIITEAEWRNLQGMVEALWRHPLLSDGELLNGQAEVSLFRRWSPDQSVLRKARIDFVHNGPSLLELKTTEDARPEAFGRTYYERKYYLQGAYYLEAWNDGCREDSDSTPQGRKSNFVIIAVEKAPPFAVVIYAADEASLRKGREDYTQLLQRYRECQASNNWPSYPTAAQALNLPSWAYTQQRPQWDPWAG